MSEIPCAESAPCFACLRCAIRMANLIPEAAHKADAALPSADGGGQWTPDPEKPDHYTFGPLDAERTIALTAASVATIPTGERVELPAGTVLRETPPPVATPQENFAALKRMYPSLAGTYERAAAKHEIAPWDVTEEQLWEECPALRPVDPDEPKPLGEQLHDEHERALRELTERVGLPREMAPSVLRVGGVPIAEVTSVRFERTVRAENVPPGMLEDGAAFATVGPAGATIPADPAKART